MAAKGKFICITARHSGQTKCEPEEGETGTVERLAWAPSRFKLQDSR